MAQRLPPTSRPVPGFGGQLVAAVLGLIFVFSLITLGFVVFFIALLVGTVFWLIFLARRWWLIRKNPQVAEAGTRRKAGDTLEGEFKVVSKDAGDESAKVSGRRES